LNGFASRSFKIKTNRSEIFPRKQTLKISLSKPLFEALRAAGFLSVRLSSPNWITNI
jgi:hypothetical protein